MERAGEGDAVDVKPPFPADGGEAVHDGSSRSR